MTSEDVVEASIDGLRRRKLFVIPGWRYKVLVGVLSKLPLGLRLGVEAAAGRSRVRQIPVDVSSTKQLGK